MGKLIKGLPIPVRNKGLAQQARSMQVGDCIECDNAKQAQNAAYHYLGRGNFAVRGKRFWRTK